MNLQTYIQPIFHFFFLPNSVYLFSTVKYKKKKYIYIYIYIKKKDYIGHIKTRKPVNHLHVVSISHIVKQSTNIQSFMIVKGKLHTELKTESLINSIREV